MYLYHNSMERNVRKNKEGKMMQEKKLTIKQSILWNSWGSIVYVGVQWLQTVLVARLLGYEDAGIFGLAMSVTNIFFAISIYGMKNFQISDIEEKYTAGNYLFSRVITGGGAFFLCTVFAIVNQYDIKQTICIVVYMLFKLSESFFDVISGFYQKHWRMDVMGKSLLIRSVLMLVIFPTIIWVTKDLLVAIIAMSLAVFLVIIFYDYKRVKILEVIEYKKNSHKIPTLLFECLPLGLYLILSTSIGSVPRYFLEVYQGTEKLGIYASVAAPTLIVQMAATYVFNPMVTVLAESYNKREKGKFLKTMKQCVLSTIVVSVVAIVGGKIFGKLGLKMLYGESIIEYEYLLTPLITCTITTAFVWLFCAVLTVLRDFRALLIGNGCAFVFSISLSIVLIPIWDMQGTTFALLFGNLAGILVFLYYMARDVKEKFI